MRMHYFTFGNFLVPRLVSGAPLQKKYIEQRRIFRVCVTLHMDATIQTL
jgi:hypothetical protein